jgi:hypothetical protein
MYIELTAVNCIVFEAVHDKCLKWTFMQGIQFALRKYACMIGLARGLGSELGDYVTAVFRRLAI